MDMLDFTTATDAQRRRVYDAIAAELGDDRFFTSKELDVLPKILAPREQVLSFSSGLMDGSTWLIVLTDLRVIFLDKGLIFGLKQTSMQLENIVTIDGETGLMFGTIRMSTAVGPHEIRNVWKRTVNAFINKVLAAKAARATGTQLLSPASQDEPPLPTPSPVPTPAPSPAPTMDMRPSPMPPPIPSAPAQPSSSAGSAIDRSRLDRLLRAGSITPQQHADGLAGRPIRP